MNERDNSYYFWGDNFGAVQKSLANDGGNMWFILPDEGITINELLADPQLSEFISTGSAWENKKHLMVNLTLPKFDISSQFDVGDKLKDMGIVDIFDTQKADFSAIESKHDALFISAVDHSVRVTVDEEGVSAAAYTAMMLYGAAEPPDDEIDFILNRPFIFILESYYGLPMFVGIVNQP